MLSMLLIPIEMEMPVLQCILPPFDILPPDLYSLCIHRHNSKKGLLFAELQCTAGHKRTQDFGWGGGGPKAPEI